MLYLVATPIGNLKDITLRAIEILKSADAIACEDTRRTGQLLKQLGIDRRSNREELPSKGGHGGLPLLSFHEHSGHGRVKEILSLLKEGKSVALVSDGGTPLISDPGFPLMREAIREGVQVEALPGPSAVVTALALSGLPTERFLFWGFLAPKSVRRRKELQALSDFGQTLVFFESPHRMSAALGDMLEILGDREASVCRELTKKFEEVVRGNLNTLVKRYATEKVLGEIVIVVAGKDRKKIFQ